MSYSAQAALVTLLELSCAHERKVSEATVEWTAHLSFVPDTKIPVVDAWIGNIGPLPFLLDTGTSVAMISNDVATALRLDVRPPRWWVSDANNSLVRANGEVVLSTLRWSGRLSPPVEAYVVDFSELSRRLGQRVVGAIGTGAFGDTVTTLDYGQARVEFGSPPLGPPDLKEIFPFRYSATGTPLVRLTVGGQESDFEVDTGDSAFMTFSSATWQQLKAPVPFVPVGVSFGADGTASTRRAARLDEDVALGQYVFRRPVIDATRGESRIGSGLLCNFRVTLDRPNRRIRFHRPQGIGSTVIESEGIRSTGATILWSGAEGIVENVLEGTPASEALKKGDRVVEVESQAAQTLAARGMSQLSSTRSSLHVKFIRDGSMHDVELRVVDLLPR